MARMAIDYRGQPQPMPELARGKVALTLAGGMVELWETKRGLYSVVYGLQLKEGLDWESAARELGACLMHYAQCEGRLQA